MPQIYCLTLFIFLSAEKSECAVHCLVCSVQPQRVSEKMPFFRLVNMGWWLCAMAMLFLYDLCETWVHEMDTERTNLRTLFRLRQNAKATILPYANVYTIFVFFFSLLFFLGCTEQNTKNDHKESTVTRAPDNEIKKWASACVYICTHT